MKTHLRFASALLAGVTILFAAVPGATAASVDINIGVPRIVTQPVYVQPRTVYVQPDYEQERAERRARAIEWRNSPANHGHAVSASAHARNDAHKSKHYKHKKHNNHFGKKKHGH